MKIKYEYVNGDVVEVEAPDEIGEFIMESLKAEHADDERYRVHNISLEGTLYEGHEYGCYDSNLRRLEAQETQKANTQKRWRLRKSLAKGYSHLTEVQRRRFTLYANGLSIREIAEVEGVHFTSIEETIEAARKKFKKFM